MFVLIQGGAFFDSIALRLLFVGGPVSVLILLLGARIWLPVWLPTITMSLAALAAALFAGEAILLSSVEVIWGTPEITNSKADYIVDLRSQGRNAHVNLFPKGLVERSGLGSMRSAISIDGEEVLPLTGISQATIVMCRNGNLEWEIFESDLFGFPNPSEVWSASSVPVGAVGDSNTQGWCVPTSQSFMGLTRSSIPGLINVGAAGNGPIADLAALREYLAPMKPKIVLWLFTGANDITDLDRELNTPVLSAYLDLGHSQGLKDLQPQIDKALVDFSIDALDTAIAGGRTIDYREAVRRMLTLYDLRNLIGIDRGAATRPNFGLLGEVLAMANSEVTAWGGKMYFVYLPTPRDATSRELPNRAGILRTAAAQQLPIIDLTQSFQNFSDPISLFQKNGGSHYSLVGHALVAAEILDGISQ
ncbi:MAG: SGNH/GDSL hydrolase family protein [Alphaproteobacteria bacterium]|nr:SGNH/GDSL hydrolase family protein [Alphaproteobacteria bacterium]